MRLPHQPVVELRMLTAFITHDLAGIAQTPGKV
jgi:hypothetical protein